MSAEDRDIELADAIFRESDWVERARLLAAYREELLKPFEELARAFNECANEKSYNFSTADELFTLIAEAREP